MLRVYSRDKAGNRTSKDLAFIASVTGAPTQRPAGANTNTKQTWKSCGSIAAKRVFRLRTSRGPSCATAKRVARRVGGRRKARVLGYSCSRTTSTYTCRQSEKMIRWNRNR